MFEIVDKTVTLNYPLGHHLHCMVSQIPNHIRFDNEEFPERVTKEKWSLVESVLKLVATGDGNLKKLHFLLFPESTLPCCHLDDALTIIEEHFQPNTVTMLGMEHMALHQFKNIVERYQDDNAELLDSIKTDQNNGEIDLLRVNWAVIAVKEADATLRIFIQAKSHPFVDEESFDHNDLYHGKIFPFFHSQPTGFNFMAMICFDYIYRTIYHSNITTVIQHANELFFSSRQHLDFLAILECNPKPEHDTFRDVINGFYGEHLAAAPGVRETITTFCNSAYDTRESLPFCGDHDTFGHSSVFIHKNHKMTNGQLGEFSVDDFAGLPVCRLRFKADSRLYYFNLPVFHEFDPRTTRMPLKVHTIFKPTTQHGWQSINCNCAASSRL